MFSRLVLQSGRLPRVSVETVLGAMYACGFVSVEKQH